MQQVIFGNASHKFYRPKYPFTSRETPLAQELNRVGFLIGRVSGDRVQFEYYSTDPFGDQAYVPHWELRDIFGQDFEGKRFEQTSEDMKRIYRPTILSIITTPKAIFILLIVLAPLPVIHYWRAKKRRWHPGPASTETERSDSDV